MIAITGASGLLGSFITSHFISQGEQVVALKRQESDISALKHLQEKILWREVDLLDPISLGESLKDVHTVIHSAALVSFNPRKAKSVFDTNVTGTKNVVDACLATGVKKLIHISSVAALGRQKSIEQINEDSIWTDSALNSDYAISKYQAELEVYRGYEEGLRVAILNPSVILGPGDWHKSSSQLFKYVWNENLFYTEGTLNYVDVRDVANMVHALYTLDCTGERFIASANSISFKKIFDEIAKRFGKKSPSLKVGSSISGVIASLEAIRCFVTNQEPVITKHTVRMAREWYHYDNKKAANMLKIRLHTLEETLDFCCQFYKEKNTTNK
jgi:nucleoside-diphosphate-sugar epimerase